MGPLLVLVSSCFRETVVFTCKIGSFLCSLDNLLQKNVIVFFLKIKFQNGAHLKKVLFLTYFSHFSLTRWESYKNSFSTCLTHIHIWILLTLLTFSLTNFEKKKYELIRYGLSVVWFLVLIRIRAILEQSINSKMVSKIEVGMSTTEMYLH